MPRDLKSLIMFVVGNDTETKNNRITNQEGRQMLALLTLSLYC